MISKEFSNTLKVISEKLRPSKMNWYVTGKGNLALQGMRVMPSRLQILIQEKDLERFLSLFNEYERTDIEELQNGEAKEFKMVVDGVEVLVCAEYPHGAYWISMQPPLQIKLEDINLPCFTLLSEREAYAKMGLNQTKEAIDLFLKKRRDFKSTTPP